MQAKHFMLASFLKTLQRTHTGYDYSTTYEQFETALCGKESSTRGHSKGYLVNKPTVAFSQGRPINEPIKMFPIHPHPPID